MKKNFPTSRQASDKKRRFKKRWIPMILAIFCVVIWVVEYRKATISYLDVSDRPAYSDMLGRKYQTLTGARIQAHSTKQDLDGISHYSVNFLAEGESVTEDADPAIEFLPPGTVVEVKRIVFCQGRMKCQSDTATEYVVGLESGQYASTDAEIRLCCGVLPGLPLDSDQYIETFQGSKIDFHPRYLQPVE